MSIPILSHDNEGWLPQKEEGEVENTVRVGNKTSTQAAGKSGLDEVDKEYKILEN